MAATPTPSDVAKIIFFFLKSPFHLKIHVHRYSWPPTTLTQQLTVPRADFILRPKDSSFDTLIEG